MPQVFYDYDADLSFLRGKTIAVLGYGNQGRSQALNAKDSGCKVLVGNIDDDYGKRAREDGFEVLKMRDAVEHSDIICILLPDEIQPDVFKDQVKPNLDRGKVLDFASGFNIYFKTIVPPEGVDVVMVAPKMIGESVRKLYLEGNGAPALVAVEQDASGNAWKTVLGFARAIGCTRAGVLKSSFEEEAVTDLFNEQSVAFIPMIVAAFEVLTEAGYDPLATQLELYGSGEWLEIIRAMLKYGIFGQGKLHSTTSSYGQFTRSQRIVTDSTKNEMRKILADIRNGEFKDEWLSEVKDGYPTLKRLRNKNSDHPILKAEAEVRKRIKLPPE